MAVSIGLCFASGTWQALFSRPKIATAQDIIQRREIDRERNTSRSDFRGLEITSGEIPGSRKERRLPLRAVHGVKVQSSHHFKKSLTKVHSDVEESPESCGAVGTQGKSTAERSR